MGVLALTDHDTTEGLAEALAAGAKYRVDVIPGVEINTDTGMHEVHILGYCIDATDDAFQTFLGQRRAGRVERAAQMVEKLRALGVRVEWERVQAIASGAAIGRPHVARALVEAGRVASVPEAFERYLSRSGPAYVPRTQLSPEEAVAAIARVGGVPVLAHPGWAASGPVLERVPHLVEHGLRGIEVYHPDHTPEGVSAYLGVARRYGLVATGGSDYHGGGSAAGQLGSVPVPLEVVPALRACWARLRQGPVLPHKGGAPPGHRQAAGGESPRNRERHSEQARREGS